MASKCLEADPPPSSKLSLSLSGLYSMLLICSYLSLSFTELVLAAQASTGEGRTEFHLEEDTGFYVFLYGTAVVFLVYVLALAFGGKNVTANKKVFSIV